MGHYDRSFAFGITVTFFGKQRPNFNEFKELMDKQFKELQQHLLNGGDIVVPKATKKDIQTTPKSYYKHGQQVIYHNIGTGIALKFYYIQYIQKKIDELKHYARSVHTVPYYKYSPKYPSQKKLQPNKSSAPYEINDFVSKLTYLGDAFIANSEIAARQPAFMNKLFKQNKLVKVSTYIHDENKLKTKMNYQQNGFEFVSVHQNGVWMKLLNALTLYPVTKTTLTKQLIRQTISMLNKWAPQNINTSYNEIKCVQHTYRNNQHSASVSKPVNLIHIDFPLDNFGQTLQYMQLMWWDPNCGLSVAQYLHLNVKQAINVWIPLVKELKSDPLVLMDISTLDESDKIVYKAVLNFGTKLKSLGVKQNLKQKWYWKSGMKIGDMIIFSSQKTPHSSAKIPNVPDHVVRASVELRCLFI
eukprot:186881_1